MALLTAGYGYSLVSSQPALCYFGVPTTTPALRHGETQSALTAAQLPANRDLRCAAIRYLRRCPSATLRPLTATVNYRLHGCPTWAVKCTRLTRGTRDVTSNS